MRTCGGLDLVSWCASFRLDRDLPGFAAHAQLVNARARIFGADVLDFLVGMR